MICSGAYGCGKELSLDNFFEADIKNRKYTCKNCKNAKRRETYRLNNSETLQDKIICWRCKQEKDKSNFTASCLNSRNFICKPCRTDQARSTRERKK